MSTPDLSGRSLLAVFAHPDDESLAAGGLLAMCASGGARVAVLCLTHGEHGPGGETRDLGRARALELHEAARVLGVRDVVLLDHEDGMLPWIDPGLLESDVAEAIRRLRPDVLVTFDEDGLYWHPDHVAVHRCVTAVVAGLGEAAPALFYVSLPAGAVRAIVDAGAKRVASDGEPLRPLFGVTDADAFGALAPGPTRVVDVGAFADRKLSALRCHRTQVEGTAIDLLGPQEAGLLGVEHYSRAAVGASGEVFLDRLGTPVAAGG
jgi:N-acetyl-1-D-myo-inositol-2-amino-2-deoxy-alpha-D-glucopyranoside deacetylase